MPHAFAETVIGRRAGGDAAQTPMPTDRRESIARSPVLMRRPHAH
jgi:hypothetical protein